MSIPPFIKAAIFDFDGLLIDSESYWDKADTELLRQRGKEYSSEVRLHVLGRGLREASAYMKNTFGFRESVEALIEKRLRLMYEFLLPNLTLMDGAGEVITGLHKKGVLLAIATGGHRKEKVTEILGKFDLHSYFSVIVDFSDVINGKPAPDPFLKAAKLLHIKPEQCLVFEDSPNGVAAAKTAGMMVYGVNKDEAIRGALKEAGADKVLRSLREIYI